MKWQQIADVRPLTKDAVKLHYIGSTLISEEVLFKSKVQLTVITIVDGHKKRNQLSCGGEALSLSLLVKIPTYQTLTASYMHIHIKMIPHLLDCKESPSFDASLDLCLANILAFLMALFFSRELIDEELIAAISAATTSAAL